MHTVHSLTAFHYVYKKQTHTLAQWLTKHEASVISEIVLPLGFKPGFVHSSKTSFSLSFVQPIYPGGKRVSTNPHHYNDSLLLRPIHSQHDFSIQPDSQMLWLILVRTTVKLIEVKYCLGCTTDGRAWKTKAWRITVGLQSCFIYHKLNE